MNYSQVLDEIFSQFNGPRFSIRFWNGTEKSYGVGDKKEFTLVLTKESLAKRLLAHGALGFGEAYMDGSLRIEGDIEAYLRLRHKFKHVHTTWRLLAASLLAKLTSPYNRKGQIAQHYDLGNDFFRMILDEDTMSYSAGKYEEGVINLGLAQYKKLEYVCALLDLPEYSTILDLGSGWGGFALYAAKNRKWKTLGYTLSNAQLTYCRKLVNKEKLEKYASFEYHDMLSKLPQSKFDAVVSLESIEHVGKRHLNSFFSNMYGILKPGGVMYIQATGRYKSRAVDPWTLKYVFPGGYLPAKSELLSAAAAAGFVITEFSDDTEDYIKTMTVWIANLESSRSVIEKMFDPSFYRLWKLWMHGAKVAFEENSMNLFRITFHKP
jgi:cyclopropane-fatty-acyl-phospholipid synthase